MIDMGSIPNGQSDRIIRGKLNTLVDLNNDSRALSITPAYLGSGDQTQRLQNILSEGKSGVRLTGGAFDVSGVISITGKNNFFFDCAPDAYLNVNPAISGVPHIIGVANSNHVAIRMNIEGNNALGANGIGLGSQAVGVEDCHILPGTTIRNLLRNPSTNPAIGGGGIGITHQFNCFDCTTVGFTVKGCTTGFDAHGWKSDPTIGLVYSNFVVTDCEDAMSFYDLADADTDPYTPEAMVVQVLGGTISRCGKSTVALSNGGDASGLNGGVIVMERARCVSIANLSIRNPIAYGAVDILRGSGQLLSLRNIDAYGNFANVVHSGRARNLLPVDSTISDTVKMRRLLVDDIRVHGTVGHVVSIDQPGDMIAARLKNVGVDVSGTLISGGSSVTDCTAEVYNIDTLASVSGTFASIVSGGNALP